MTPNIDDSRRRFLSASGALAITSLAGWHGEAAAEPPPEITTIRLIDFPTVCMAATYFAEEFLYAEGFRKVEYVAQATNIFADSDSLDIDLATAAPLVASLDEDSRFLAVAGIHPGCQELFGNERVQAIRDLRGKSVAVSALGSGEHVSVASVAAYVGIDPNKEINWVVANSSEGALQLFIDGKADAYWAFEPQPHELKAKKIGHVILNTTEDKPWSQYFCCLLAMRTEFVRRYPIATKRAMRAYLKASDICAQQPERVARFLADKGQEPRYELSLEVLNCTVL